MEFLTSCLWKFCLIYGILAFLDGNLKFESGSRGLYYEKQILVMVISLASE